MTMTLQQYSQQALTTMLKTHEYGDVSAKLTAQVLGLLGESGEIAEKFKKIIRDKDGKLSPEEIEEILKELGDVLWYVNAISNLLGSDLETVASLNIDKVTSRKARGVSHGSGDNR